MSSLLFYNVETIRKTLEWVALSKLLPGNVYIWPGEAVLHSEWMEADNYELFYSDGLGKVKTKYKNVSDTKTLNMWSWDLIPDRSGVLQH